MATCSPIIDALLSESDDALATLAPGDDLASLLSFDLTPKERKQVRWGVWYRVVTAGMTNRQKASHRMKARFEVAVLRLEFGERYHERSNNTALTELLIGDAGPRVTNIIATLHQRLSAEHRSMILNDLRARLPGEKFRVSGSSDRA